MHYVWEFYPRWSLDAMFQFFALKFQQYDGNLQDYNAAVCYMPWRNFGAMTVTSCGDTAACGVSSRHPTEPTTSSAFRTPLETSCWDSERSLLSSS
ncbi:MAG TPA: hypothetical protein VE819_12000 [Steroidobacteraceae bacterium]|nr:hypothetical protein [Steroidobacteraceae bacterium]